MMPRKIVVPVDLSQQDAAAAALAQARQMDADATLVLLHVLPHIPEYYATHIPSNVLQSEQDSVMGELRAFAQQNGVSDTATLVLRKGSPGREILNYASDNHTDLIVIASHDPGWGDLILGSVAAFVVRHAHCSVLVVRNPDGQ